jgi:Flp pilus assembly pilin Flp
MRMAVHPIEDSGTGKGEMLSDRRGADLVEWIVAIVIAVGVVGTSVYSLFQVIGGKFDDLNTAIQ